MRQSSLPFTTTLRSRLLGGLCFGLLGAPGKVGAEPGALTQASGLNRTTKHLYTTLGVLLMVAQPSWLRAQARGLCHQDDFPESVTVSKDGKHVSVASDLSSAVAVLRREK